MTKRKIYAASIFGEILEWYDFTLYSTMAPVFAILFFPKGNLIAGILGTFAIFAVGFISRPIGGLVFGFLGDCIGRKLAFILSLIFMAFPTFLIGLLPIYQEKGLIAPILLLILRLAQGFSCGGEFSTSMVFLSEHARKNNYYFSGSLAWLGAMLGTLISSLLVASLSLNKEFLYSFGWRIPFFLGGLIALSGIFLRIYTPETPTFIMLKKNNRNKSTVFSFLKNQKMAVIKIFLINIQLAILSYIGIAFLPTFLSKFVGMNLSAALFINTLLILMLIFLIPCAGYVADKVGGRKVFVFSLALTILFAIPIYLLFSLNSTWILSLLAALLIAIPSALGMSVIPGISMRLTSPEQRVITLSFSYNLVYCLLGGTAPLVTAYVIHQTNLLIFPALYIIFFTIISSLSFFIIDHTSSTVRANIA